MASLHNILFLNDLVSQVKRYKEDKVIKVIEYLVDTGEMQFSNNKYAIQKS
jgi:hypothetical protein